VQVSLWNHDSARPEQLVGRNGGAVSLQMAWSVLWTPSRTGSYAFSVIDPVDPKWRPCPSEPPSGDLLELARVAGGFSVPAAVALRAGHAELGTAAELGLESR